MTAAALRDDAFVTLADSSRRGGRAGPRREWLPPCRPELGSKALHNSGNLGATPSPTSDRPRSPKHRLALLTDCPLTGQVSSASTAERRSSHGHSPATGLLSAALTTTATALPVDYNGPRRHARRDNKHLPAQRDTSRSDFLLLIEPVQMRRDGMHHASSMHVSYYRGVEHFSTSTPSTAIHLSTAEHLHRTALRQRHLGLIRPSKTPDATCNSAHVVSGCHLSRAESAKASSAVCMCIA